MSIATRVENLCGDGSCADTSPCSGPFLTENPQVTLLSMLSVRSLLQSCRALVHVDVGFEFRIAGGTRCCCSC